MMLLKKLAREGVPKETWKIYKKFAREIAKASLRYSVQPYLLL